MSTETTALPRESLTLVEHGLFPIRIFANLTPPALIEHALRRGEGQLTDHGAFVGITTPHTGRSPKDKFVVAEAGAADRIWLEKNPRLEAAAFEHLHDDVRGYLDAREVFVQDLFGGADPAYRVPVRFITPNAWHALFVRNMFIRALPAELAHFRPGFTVLHAPDFQADPARHGTRSGTFVVIHFGKKLVLIGGTRYAGEMKKSIFTALNYLLPKLDVMPMHCSANVGPAGDTAVFFGLSGTGKTTLSADPTRQLIGDDEHGWSDRGVFNFEGGCYAKVIKLRRRASRRSTRPRRCSARCSRTSCSTRPPGRSISTTTSLTENTRACYPMHYIPNHLPAAPADTRRTSCSSPPTHSACCRPSPAHARAGDVPLPLRLHREGRGHRARRHRAAGHLLGLLRRAVPALHPGVYAGMLGERIAQAQGQGVAREHRVDRRAVRRRASA